MFSFIDKDVFGVPNLTNNSTSIKKNYSVLTSRETSISNDTSYCKKSLFGFSI